MEKIANYIKNGKGNGLMFLLAAAVLVSILFVLMIKDIYAEVKPRVLLVAEDILPINVQNGEIVDPVGEYKELELKLDNKGEDSFRIVLDTKDENAEVPSNKLGLYITKHMLYLITPNEVKRVSYTDGFFDMSKFTEMMNQAIGIFSLILSIVSVGVLFVVFLIKAVIVGSVGRLIFKTKKIDVSSDFSLVMRASSICVAIMELCFFTIGFCLGYTLSGLIRLVFEIGLFLVFFYKNQSLLK